MDEEKKTSRWAKSLDKAGILDPINEDWELPDDASLEDAVIVVDKHPHEPPRLSSSAEKTLPRRKPLVSPARSTSSKRAPTPPPGASVETLRKQMVDRFEVADFTGALIIAEQILSVDSGDQEASIFRLKCRSILMQMFESRIGPLKRIPVPAVSQDEILWRDLDATTAFIASNVDGIMSFEDIIDISTVSRFETCRILTHLIQDGIIK